MRDPKRLDGFYEDWKNIHKRHFPDIRFGQLCSNFFGWLMQEKGRDLFFPEEKEMLAYFREYAGETGAADYFDLIGGTNRERGTS